MRKVIDLTGERFGKLVVMNRAEDHVCPSGQRHAKWHCRCDCNNEVEVLGADLRRGHTQSCGCLQKEVTVNRNKENSKLNNFEIIGDDIVVHASKCDFVIDKDDEWVLADYCWCLDGGGYLAARERGTHTCAKLHRLIMDCPKDMVIDHVDGNPLNNRKSNLRIVTQSQNCMNRRAESNNTSGVTGVSFDKSAGKWKSKIVINGKDIYLGLFSDFEDAVSARKVAEQKYFGEYSFDNSRNRTVVC